MGLLSSARFATTVAKLAQLPRGGLPEIAFVGRSNAGKSTAINLLCGRRRLAFASRTPGRTQALNLFLVGPDAEPAGYLVDTPGYGYAQAPLELKRGWDRLAGRYLEVRETLHGVVLVMDIRRGVTALDEALLGWVPPGAPVLVLLTKADKLGTAEQRRTRREVAERLAGLGFAGDALHLVTFSALSRQGLDEAGRIVESWLRTPAHASDEQPRLPETTRRATAPRRRPATESTR